MVGSGKDLLLVIGDGVDAGKLTRKLKKEVGDAEIVELRTLPGTGSTTNGASTVVTRSPYQQRHPTPGRSMPGGGRIKFPVAAAARWPGEHGGQPAVSYYHRTPSPGYYQQHYAPSPMAAGQGGYGYGYGLYTREVARSHPANYSPMIARHDSRAAGEGRRERGGGEPNCCSIL
ncbi:hypothetical protein BAE44_0003881 [Dichanthelium oligosanthes]|uniref:Uncharacterized protein n=1 Tax=Dichanthelium oligosanthes TaxID=888268 RepID=A0A1E5WCI6_9POAL|nr:hypothetical protein BAE44_0003881 [Dichanthelium oligosanthes]